MKSATRRSASVDHTFDTHHDPCADGDAAAAVRVRHNVTEADAEERDSYQPHGVQQVGVVFVVKPKDYGRLTYTFIFLTL